jgi:hypothetical protein
MSSPQTTDLELDKKMANEEEERCFQHGMKKPTTPLRRVKPLRFP